MDKLGKLQKLHQYLATRRYPTTIRDISQHLECSDKTTYRLLRQLIDEYHAPINEDKKGYRYYDLQQGQTFELPGLWFNDAELHALLAAHQYLNLIEPNLLGSHIEPLKQRIEDLLEKHHYQPATTLERIRILGIGNRPNTVEHFNTLAEAVLAGKRLHLVYQARSHGDTTEREVSPQRLTHYRDNWYLDAWCHRKQGLRTFALDCILACQPLTTRARIMPKKQLDAHYASAYGIFAGKADKTALLKFTEKRARWIEKEQWHPRQTGCWQDDHYLLSLPYHNPTELIMDILKYGPDVEVLEPESLKQAVKAQIEAMRALYEK